MTNEKIQALIFSDTHDEKIVKKLIKWFSINPDLINERFVLNRTFFHLLVIKNKARALELLLESSTWKTITPKSWQDAVALTDRNGHTLMHYVARADKSFQPALKILFKLLPSHLNAVTNNRNTPLHEAILAEQLWSIRCIVEEGKGNCSIANGDNKTPIQLCQSNIELLNALFSVEISMTNAPDLRQKPNIEQFRQLFPTLSSRSTGSALATTLRRKDNLSRSNTETSLKESSSEHSFKEDESLKVTPLVRNDDIINILRQMILTFREQKRSATYQSLQKQFISFCLNNLFPFDLNIGQEPLAQLPEGREVVFDVLETLSANVGRICTHNDNKKSKVLKSFIYTVIPHMSAIESETRDIPISNDLESDPNYITLWLIASGQETPDSKCIFNFERISLRALGLMRAVPLLQILINFRRLYPYFDSDQKIVANFIILKLLHFNTINDVTSRKDTDFQLKLFCKLNVDDEYGLGNLGVLINHHLNQLNELTSHHVQLPQLRNFSLLNRALNQLQMTQSLPSFNGLVDQALAKPTGQRSTEVQIIVHELRMLTLRFYQQVSIAEFNDKSWTKEDRCPQVDEEDHQCDSNCPSEEKGRSALSPNIVENTRLFNNLNNYFISKVLSQPTEQIKNAIKLFIEIGQELCPMAEDQYHDLNHLMLISSILNCAELTRIIASEDLSTKELSYMEEITELVTKSKNSKHMRDLYRSCTKTLPFVGELITDITFAEDGNTLVTLKSELIGLVFKKLMEVKLLLNFERVTYQTNLLHMMSGYVPVSDEVLYNSSLRQQPRKIDVITLKNTNEDLLGSLDTLTKEFIPNGLIPALVVNKKHYKPNEVPDVLIDIFRSKVKSLKKEQDKGPENSQESDLIVTGFKKLKNVVPALIEVLNAYYVPLNLSEPKKLAFYTEQLDELQHVVKSMQDQQSSKYKRSESKLHLDKSGFFKPEPKDSESSSRSGSNITPRAETVVTPKGAGNKAKNSLTPQ